MNNNLSLSTANNGPSGALAKIESSRAVQEVQAAMLIAKHFPRDQKASLDRILNACTRPSLANVAVYQYARGGTDISGPSIRLAEAIAQNWGNLQFGIRELEQSNGESTVEAYAWDVETNTRQVKTFQVPHSRYTKTGGNKPLTDPRDIYERIANDGARRLRACILGVIPGDVVEEALRQCEQTMAADADTSPEAQTKILEAFAKFGVTKDQIEKRIQRRMDSITAAQVISLRKIRASLRDGMSKAEEWFPVDSTPAAVVPMFEKPRADDLSLVVEAPTAAAFWKRCEVEGMDQVDTMEVLKQNGSTVGEFPADLTDKEAALLLPDRIFAKIVELVKGGAK